MAALSGREGIRGQVSRNTLANANATRDWRIDADFAERLIGIDRKLLAFVADGDLVVRITSRSAPGVGGEGGSDTFTFNMFRVQGAKLAALLRLTLAPRGVGVSVLCPGLTRSHILEDARLSVAEQFAMDPRIVGTAVLDGIRRNHAFILPHGEFVQEVRAMHEEIVASVRTDLPVDPRRAAFEESRRMAIAKLRA